MRVLRSVARFLLLEGAFRSGKTWACLIKWRRRIDEHHGISLVMARWLDGDLHTKLIPDYRKVCDLMGLPYGHWNGLEECFEFPHGSRLYAIALKSSEKTTQHAKSRGFTIAGIYISQLEEVPEGVAREWMLRLTQPGYPKQFLADANPVHDGHWIAGTWPEDNSKPDYEYHSMSIWQNAHNLDAEDIAAAEALYPIGDPLRPAKLEGKRGVNTEGDPVYGGYFRPSTHVCPGLPHWPHAPILVGWDFGSKHPAVSFAQFLPWGAFWSLGAVMGDNVMLEWFAPRLLLIAAEWFPDMPLMHCGDPAGAHRTSQGVTLNAKKVLQGLGITLKTLDDSNDLRVRYGCIQTLGGYMLREARAFDGEPDAFARAEEPEPAFLLNPRGILISRKGEKAVSLMEQAFGGGYIWDNDFHGTGNLANIRRPMKDGFFEHPMNANEYIVHNYARTRVTDSDVLQNVADAARLVKSHARAVLIAAQTDEDTDPWNDLIDGTVPMVPVDRGARFSPGRAGY